MKRHLTVLGTMAAALILGVGLAFAIGILYLPSGPVCVSHGQWNAGTNSTLDITLSSVPDGFDVTNGLYTGWCIEDNFMPDHSGCDVVLLDSTDTEPLECYPGDYPGYPWDKINYLLNHKNGTDGTIPATIQDIQVAMWLLTGTNHGTFPLTDEAQNLFDDADLWGEGFVPGPGEIAAVVLCVDGNSPGWGYQDTLIEVVLFQGCTPGYWKQSQHLFAWVGHAPEDLYGETFGVTPSAANLNLLRALQMGGGGERALYRHATAALLNAANPDVNFPYTEAQVIAIVRAAYASGNFEGAKNQFEAANEAGCPLGNGVESVAGQGATSQSN